MSTVHNFDDIWMLQPNVSQPKNVVKHSLVDGVAPLDARSVKTVPDVLFEPLFGQPDAANPLHVYAILDAAKVTNLPEMLEVSGQEYCCLFKGAAFDELKDHAPWLVRLDHDNAFTRSLFVKSDAGWFLWDSVPGVYLRSHVSLREMRQHLRKFTKVRDETGKWYYFRFWEADCLKAVLLEGDQRTSRALLKDMTVVMRDGPTWSIICQDSVPSSIQTREAFILRQDDVNALRHAVFRRFVIKLHNWVEGAYGAPAAHSTGSAEDLVLSLISQAWHRGISIERTIADYVAVGWLTGQLPKLDGADPSRYPAVILQQRDAASKQRDLLRL